MPKKHFASLNKHINRLISRQCYTEALDTIGKILNHDQELSISFLPIAYDIAQAMPDKSRYAQYQSRYFDFGIKPGDKVLDMGSGHIPFPLATHLADIAIEDHNIGRAGVPFKHVDGKPVYECSIEQTPFGDKEFDFVYCSHVLEHVRQPEIACRELMRIGKRGYIECPSPGKDMFFNTARLSNHLWGVECLNGVLIFTEYTDADKNGLGSGILLEMTCAPRTVREKAVAGLEFVTGHQLNTMLLWEGAFDFKVRRQSEWPANITGPRLSGEGISFSDMPEEPGRPMILKKLSKKTRRLRSKLARFIDPEAC